MQLSAIPTDHTQHASRLYFFQHSIAPQGIKREKGLNANFLNPKMNRGPYGKDTTIDSGKP